MNCLSTCTQPHALLEMDDTTWREIGKESVLVYVRKYENKKQESNQSGYLSGYRA